MNEPMTALATIIMIISDNFWILLLIMLMYAERKNRLGAIMLLVAKICFDRNVWVYAAIIFITYCTNYLQPKEYYKNKYKKKLERYQKLNESKTNYDIEDDDESHAYNDDDNVVEYIHNDQ